ncbi:endonuclease/exonuclease/phosphatase family protein [Microlunatus sp. Gsoil 973]|uniref:endonuclease/exonuclease/phosphatase family protein n=1 Tax=Microlunatus sp. Gsoil 973 TaxID=2672569 RepID=UPI0012B50050|nr:endonuclease/exonuclease/phosphatase family protein [Microlunatus sp. Gsoil 973]QGN35184.1 endonuclease/exonuclease/phosphatase [Microlunatus sp. Gsoil 973]
MAATRAPIRLLTYNIHRWGDDRQAVAEIIARCAPDVAMIQEAPTWWGTRRRRLAFARSVGLHYATGAARTIALVADPLRWTARRARIRRPAVRRRKRLVALQLPGGAVAVSGSDPVLTVIGCHLGLARSARSAELEQVFGLRRPGEPTVIVGDVNERPGGPVWQLAGRAGLADATADAGPTFPARDPQARIDAVWASPELTVNRIDPNDVGVTTVLMSRASDHLPVLVELRRS